MFFLVSQRYRFLLGWSAKCGCSSVKHWYLNIHDIPTDGLGMRVYAAIGYGDTQYTRVDWDDPRRYEDYRKLVLVRNPYSRVVSGFLNKYVLTSEFPNQGWHTFNEFLRVLKKDKQFRKVDTHHFCPQFSEAYSAFQRAGFRFDDVLQVESFAADLARTSAALGAPSVFAPTVNRTRYSHEPGVVSNMSDVHIDNYPPQVPTYEHFYTPANSRLVREIYRADFEALAALGLHYEDPCREEV